MRNDLRYAWRSLRNSPGFTAVAVITLALGLGATTVVVSGVNALFLRDLPVSAPDRLYVVNELRRGVTNSDMALPIHWYTRYLALRDLTADAVDGGLAAFRYRPAFIRLSGDARTRSAVVASSNYFEVLGLEPVAGRFFGDGSTRGVVISHEVWRRELGGASDVMGRPIQVDGKPFEMAGVAPPGFNGTVMGLVAEFWIPADLYRQPAGRDDRPRDLQ